MSEDFWKWLNRLFSGEKASTLYNLFYDHPIIKNYGENLFFKKPSYLTPGNFSAILIETIKNLDEEKKQSIATFSLLETNLKNALEQNKDEKQPKQIDKETLQILNYHLKEAAGDLDVFKYRLEKWYNDTMDRVSGWYKRNTQFYLFGLGLFLAVSLNIDSIELTKYLSDNKTAREQLAQMGVAAASNKNLSGKDTIAKEALDSIKVSINKANTLIGLGWGDYGSSDRTFKKYIIPETAHTCSKFYEAFNNNKTKADSIFSVQCDNTINKLITEKKADSRTLNKVADSLNMHKEEIVSQTQFALLYKNDDYQSSLERKYIWFRFWSWRKILGFLITSLAIGLGAPFWFDLLNKFVSLRTAVKTVNSSGSTTNNNSANSNEIDR